MSDYILNNLYNEGKGGVGVTLQDTLGFSRRIFIFSVVLPLFLVPLPDHCCMLALESFIYLILLQYFFSYWRGL